MGSERSKLDALRDRALFWDVDPESIDMERKADFVIERALEYGTWDQVKLAREHYGDERIRQYILKRGFKVLSNKTFNFWLTVFDLHPEEWPQLSSRSVSRKFWNY